MHRELTVAVFAMGFGAFGAEATSQELPAPALDVPVDVDGDGRASFGDRYFFNWWLAQGGSLTDALAAATSDGMVVDVSGFFASTEAQLSAGDLTALSTAAGGGGGGSCPPPAESPNHTRRIPSNVEPDGPSFHGRTTGDGRFIVFSSSASNLPGANGFRQIYVFEQGTSSEVGNVSLVSIDTQGNPAGDHCDMPSISDDGDRIVFHTRATLDIGVDTDSSVDVYLRDRSEPLTIRMSEPFVQGGARGDSTGAAISADGRFIAFTTTADDLTAGDVNGPLADVVRVDIDLSIQGDPASVELVSLDNAGFQSTLTPLSTIGDQAGSDCAAIGAQPPGLGVGRVISGDGRFVLMHGSPCDWAGCLDGTLCPDRDGDCCVDLTPACQNPRRQVYMRDMGVPGVPARTLIVSRAARFNPGEDGIFPGNDCSRRASISRDASRIAFSSFATNYRLSGLDGDGFEDVFVMDRAALEDTMANATRVSATCSGAVDGNSFQPILSADGRRIVFASEASTLLCGAVDTNGLTDVFIRDEEPILPVTRRFNVATDGTQVDCLDADPDPVCSSTNPDGSADGRIAVYESLADTLLGPNGDMNDEQDIFQTPSPQGPFIRADADNSGEINLTDGVYINNWLFQGGPPPPCYDAADADDDGKILGNDSTYIWNYLFQGGPPPECPFCCSPTTSCCGRDPTGDGLPCGTALAGCTQFGGDGSCP